MSDYGEPWWVEESGVAGLLLPSNYRFMDRDGKPVDYTKVQERIVACVNACQGISTEELKAAKSWPQVIADSSREELRHSRKQIAKMPLTQPSPDPGGKTC